MKNSFKKAVAWLLAVLMVAFSVPFSALADEPVIDFDVDVDVVFGTLFDNGTVAGDGPNMWFPEHSTTADNVDLSYAGPLNAPVTLNNNGQLVLTSAATEGFSVDMMEDPDMVLPEDYVLQNGDLFTVTVIAHNIDTMNALYAQLTWNSEAISPAGLVRYKGNSKLGKNSWHWLTLGELEAKKQADANYKEHEWLIGGTKPLYDVSCGNLYKTVNYQDEKTEDESEASEEFLQATALALNGTDVSVCDAAPNPYTGEYDGYFSNNHNCIVETFIFKVLDNTKQLNFDMYDKENAINHDYTNGRYVAGGGSMSPKNLITYSYNTYTNAYDEGASDPTKTENWGSRHMTFQGQRYETSAPAADEYTVTFLDAEGTEISHVTGPTGTAVTAPDLADYAKAADATGHYTTSWDAEVPAAIGSADATYQVTYSEAIPHVYGEPTNVVDASCTAGGSYDETCECGYVNHVETGALGHLLNATAATAATCTTDGNSAYWTCSRCNKYFSDAQGTNEIEANSWVIPAAHQDVQHVAAVPATTTTDGNIEYWYCAACQKYFSDAACTNEITQADTVVPATGYTYVFDHIDFAENDGVVTAKAILVAQEDSTKTKEADVDSCAITSTVPATCTAKGTATWTATYGAESATYEQELAMIAHTPGEAAQEDVVPATCTAKGSYNEVVRCTVCNEILSSEPKEIDKIAHTPGEAAQEDVVPATCTEAGSYNEVVRCTVCNEIISSEPKEIKALGHSFGEWTETKAPTKKEAGEEKRECSRCDAYETREIAALGYTVTIAKADLGTVTGTIESDGQEVSANLQAGANYTVTANPAEGAEFVGWQIGNKIVTENATYSSVVYSDVTLTPVYVETAATNVFTVLFYDLYGNVVDTFTGDADAWAAFELPAGPARPGYTFTGWDKAKDDITASATVWAQYEKETTGTYTVTTNATLTLPEGIDNGSIPYNTKVTVKDDNATAWQIGETVVAYGTEYSFFVGSNVEIQPVYAAVSEVPTVAIVGADIIAGTTRYNYVASMTVPAGFKIADRGFVYGKNLAAADLDIEKEGKKGSYGDSGNVKVIHVNSTSSEQFSLMYGISNGDRKLGTVKAFIITSDGEIHYSNMFTLDYATGSQVDNI